MWLGQPKTLAQYSSFLAEHHNEIKDLTTHCSVFGGFVSGKKRCSVFVPLFLPLTRCLAYLTLDLNIKREQKSTKRFFTSQLQNIMLTPNKKV